MSVCSVSRRHEQTKPINLDPIINIFIPRKAVFILYIFRADERAQWLSYETFKHRQQVPSILGN